MEEIGTPWKKCVKYGTSSESMGKKGLDLNNLQKWTKVDNTVLVHGNTAHLFSSCSALRLDSKGRRLVKDVDLLGSAATQGLVNRWTYETHTHTYT